MTCRLPFHFCNKLRSRLLVRHTFPQQQGKKHIFRTTRVQTKLATALSFDLPRTSGTFPFASLFYESNIISRQLACPAETCAINTNSHKRP